MGSDSDKVNPDGWVCRRYGCCFVRHDETLMCHGAFASISLYVGAMLRRCNTVSTYATHEPLLLH
jgi:hypothetical protein